MSDPFLSASPPTKANHKPTLSVLIQNTNDAEDDDNSHPVDLPTAPPLDHNLFNGQDFDPSTFLLGRRHTGLDDLRSELRAYLATLRTSLVAVINEEYEAFIGLSLGLRHANVATSLSTIRRPVLSIRTEVTRVKDELESMKHEMESVLGDRKEVREAKAVLRRLLEMEEQVEKVEGLLKLGEGAKEREGGERMVVVVDSPAKRLERIAGEYSQMLYLVEKAGDFPFVRSLDPRISRITSTLQLDLSQLLTTVLLSSPTTHPKSTRESLTSLFRTYASLGLHSSAESIIRRTIIKPFVLKTIHRDVLSSPQSPIAPSTPFGAVSFDQSFPLERSGSGLGPSINVVDKDEKSGTSPPFYNIEPIRSSTTSNEATSSEPLAELYNKILAFVSRDCGMMLDIAERTLSVPPPATSLSMVLGGAEEEKKKRRPGYDILSDVIWDDIAGRLMSELGHVIYAAGRPTVFHRNYTLTSTFISRLESLCPTLSHLTTLRSHPTYISFLRRFQLPVYFQLRFKEIVTNVERALDSSPSNPGSGESFLMAESEAIWKALKMAWDEEVYLPELAARFWKLTLQLVSRYRTWLNSVVTRYSVPVSVSSNNLSALSAGGTASTRSSFDAGRPTNQQLSAASANSSRPGTPGFEEPSEESTLRHLTVLIADSRLMERKVYQLFDERIRGKLLGGEDESSEGSAAAVLRDSLALVSSIGPSLSNQIISILTKRCADHLKHVKPVVSQVRASTRKGPQEPSFFVRNIFKDLRAYVTGPGKVVEEELRTKWASAVVEDVMSRYAVILTTTKKTQAGLRWLKKGRQGLGFFGRTATVDDGATEEDKVKLQMQLDIDTLVKEAASIGIDVTESVAYAALRKSIEESETEAAA
ncbi:conserved oligomeric Golgi complex subunit 2, partial [Phenoliferia sp. Uapishka_3]